jgi:DNA-binding GntR family transcriptional regulator
MPAGGIDPDSVQSMRRSGRLRNAETPFVTSSVVIAALSAAISAGDLPAGAKLAEDALTQVFGVSRTIVRESLRQMSSSSLVTLLPNRGAFVARPEARDAEDLYEARRLIEAEIVFDVSCYCTAHDIRHLRGHLTDQAAAHAANDKGRYIRLLGTFHILLAEMASNRIYCELVKQLVPRTVLINELYEDDGPSICAVDEHAEIVNQLAAGNSARCVELMREHLTINAPGRRLRPTSTERIDLAAALAPYVVFPRRDRAAQGHVG